MDTDPVYFSFDFNVALANRVRLISFNNFMSNNKQQAVSKLTNKESEAEIRDFKIAIWRCTAENCRTVQYNIRENASSDVFSTAAVYLYNDLSVNNDKNQIVGSTVLLN